MSGGPVPIWKKYTTGSTGIWEKLRQFLVLVPNRSSGNPVVALYRNPPPGARISESQAYKEAITIPAGDIRNNAYHKRDYRRNYPQVHGFNQAKVSGLLKLGSVSLPRISVGDKGTQELATYTGSSDVSLATTLSSIPADVVKGEVLGASGEPIVAPSLKKFNWTILREPQHGMYTEDYPCRMFTEAKATQ
ncbi:hypothetical protein CAAN1_21S02212 [[Candida] anglica]|uniref:Uncharacterized protein n=1 Tax=[Candida] anglica TaxID=148631 RepID=A0ABP0EIF6_9ASCO